MTEVTFETMPKAMEYLIAVVEDLAKALKEKEETPAAQADKWMNLDELIAYLPDRPAKSMVYNWISTKQIPNHKGGKKLRFLQSEIDAWLSEGKRVSESELRDKADKYCETRKIASL